MAPHDDEPWVGAEIDVSSTSGGDEPIDGTRATGAPRRILIAWVAVALIALLGFGVGQRLAVDHVAGTAGGAWHDGPTVGSCVDLTGGFVLVPCDGPHDAEVTRVDGPRPSGHTSAGQPAQDADTVCRRAADDYVGASSVGLGTAGPGVSGDRGWLEPGINGASAVVSAPRDERTGPFGWTACAVQPAVAHRYLGSVHGAVAAGGGQVPAAYRTCFGPGGMNDAVSCAAPHTAEQVAVLPGSPLGDFGWENHSSAGDVGDGGGDRDGPLGAGAPTVPVDPSAPSPHGQDDGPGMSGFAAIQFDRLRDEVHAQCAQAASAVLGTDDPTYGGRLTIESVPGENSGPLVVWQNGSTGADGASDGWYLTHAMGLSGPNLCLVRTVGGGGLTDSLIGWGDASLPLITS